MLSYIWLLSKRSLGYSNIELKRSTDSLQETLHHDKLVILKTRAVKSRLEVQKASACCRGGAAGLRFPAGQNRGGGSLFWGPWSASSVSPRDSEDAESPPRPHTSASPAGVCPGTESHREWRYKHLWTNTAQEYWNLCLLNILFASLYCSDLSI